MEPPEARAPGHPAGRGGDPPLAGRALARAQKKAEEEGRTIVFVDESGFSLLPALVRTFAPRGSSPVIRERWTNDHLAAISGVTPQGKLSLQVQEAPFRSPAVVRFRWPLRRHLAGKALVLWDGAPIHRSNVIKDFLAASAATWLQVERLPAYAPELNPDEGVWHYLKGGNSRTWGVSIWPTSALNSARPGTVCATSSTSSVLVPSGPDSSVFRNLCKDG